MFKVACKGGFENRRPVLSGVTFGVFGKPITFEVQAEGMPYALTVRFQLCDDVSKPPAYFVVGPIVSGALDIVFYNVVPFGSASISEPCSTVFANQVDLQLIVHVDRIQGTQTYRMTYEFSEVDMMGKVQ